MVPWWYVPVSWFVLIGIGATVLVIAAGVVNYKKRKRSHRDHVHVKPSSLTLLTGPGEDPRDG